MAKRSEKRRAERASPRRERAVPPSGGGPDPGLRVEPLHVALVVGGILVALLGYRLLDQGSISMAPMLLVLAYLVLVPIGLALPARRRSGDRDSERS